MTTFVMSFERLSGDLRATWVGGVLGDFYEEKVEKIGSRHKLYL